MKSCCEPVVTRVRVADLHDWAGISVAVVHGWTDETAHLEYVKRKSNPRKEKKTFPLTWSPSGRTSSFAMAICHHVIKKSNEKRILLKGKQLFSSRSHPKRSPTQNHFHQDRPHHKMIEKVQRKTHVTQGKQPFSSRSPPSKSE